MADITAIMSGILDKTYAFIGANPGMIIGLAVILVLVIVYFTLWADNSSSLLGGSAESYTSTPAIGTTTTVAPPGYPSIPGMVYTVVGYDSSNRPIWSGRRPATATTTGPVTMSLTPTGSSTSISVNTPTPITPISTPSYSTATPASSTASSYATYRPPTAAPTYSSTPSSTPASTASSTYYRPSTTSSSTYYRPSTSSYSYSPAISSYPHRHHHIPRTARRITVTGDDCDPRNPPIQNHPQKITIFDHAPGILFGTYHLIFCTTHIHYVRQVV